MKGVRQSGPTTMDRAKFLRVTTAQGNECGGADLRGSRMLPVTPCRVNAEAQNSLAIAATVDGVKERGPVTVGETRGCASPVLVRPKDDHAATRREAGKSENVMLWPQAEAASTTLSCHQRGMRPAPRQLEIVEGVTWR